MSDTAADRAAAVKDVRAATADADPGVQQAALEALLGPPGQGATDYAWKVLVSALAIALLLALVGLVYVVADGNNKTSATPLIAAVSSILSGLLGLFITPPGKAK